eukprot:747866-Hanusia_phi.AAC.1
MYSQQLLPTLPFLLLQLEVEVMRHGRVELDEVKHKLLLAGARQAQDRADHGLEACRTHQHDPPPPPLHAQSGEKAEETEAMVAMEVGDEDGTELAHLEGRDAGDASRG